MIGSLFTGAGALDLAVENTWGGNLTWFAENDHAIAAVTHHHHPRVPNIGDVTRTDWNNIPPVRILTGGPPCQDLSHAGKRKGLTDGTRSNLWVQMREAIAVLQPELVVWENVRGATSATADSEVEPCPGCVGNPVGLALRALGRVLGDLADLGYDARWHGCRASEVDAPHDRYRIFLLAYPEGSAPPHPTDPGPDRPGSPRHRGTGAGLRVRPRRLLPTPTVLDRGAGLTEAQWDTWTQDQAQAQGNGNGHGNSLEVEAKKYLRRGNWGNYTPAILRWEAATRPAPVAVRHNPFLNRDQVTPEFAEWMMGHPEGHVTHVGLSRKAALRAIGNSVVPQQAEAAFRLMCTW